MQTRSWKMRGMRSMVILVDTNILIDVIADRQPFAKYANIILEKCARRDVIGVVAAHSITDLFYVLRKDFSQAERRKFLKDICAIFRVSDLNRDKILSALDNSEFEDFEDCLQDECAVEEMADYIVTRNPKDFEKSRIKVVNPEEFIKLLQKE